MRTAHRARLAAILALGAFAVHQLRYLIAFGSSSSEELARQGHGYMAAWLPILGVFTISALLGTLIRGRFGARLAQASLSRRGGDLRRGAARDLRHAGVPRGGRGGRSPGRGRGGPRVRRLVGHPAGRSDRFRRRAARQGARAGRDRDRGPPDDSSPAEGAAQGGKRSPGRGRPADSGCTCLWPRSAAPSTGTCLVRYQSARVVPSFRQRRHRAHIQGGSSGCNRGLHGSA